MFLDTYVVSPGGQGSETYTRARARFAIGGGPTFKVYEEGFFSSIGKAVGTHLVTTSLRPSRGPESRRHLPCRADLEPRHPRS